MPFDPVTWAIGWLLGRLAGGAWSYAFQKDAKKRLRQSMKVWAKELKQSGDFSDFDEQSLFTALFSPRDTDAQKTMRDKLTEQTGVPDAGLICEGLVDSWHQVREELGDDAQSFFQIDEDQAQRRLLNLATLIYGSCFESAAQRGTFDNTKKMLENLAEIEHRQQHIYDILANRGREPHVKFPYFMADEAYSSRMAVADVDVERILLLRRKHFGANVVSSDESYWACWTRERDSMKIVCDGSGEDLGYWSLFPVEELVFQQFIKGKLSHEEMLTQYVLRWEDVVEAEVFLYVVGIVVPNGGSYVCGRVLLDLFSFGIDIINRLNVTGIFGYPSRDAGYEIFEHAGFANSGVFIDNDEAQPVFFVPQDDDHLARVKRECSQIVRKEFKRVPIWNALDRQRFLKRITN